MSHIRLEVDFTPSSTQISAVRNFVDELWKPVCADADVRARLGLSTHEMLDNAVRYSLDGRVLLRIDAVGSGAGYKVVLQTSAPASEVDAAKLARALEIPSSPSLASPDARYAHEMARIDTTNSGFALRAARIAAEGQMDLRCAYDGKTLEVTATLEVETTKGAGT
ncbi:MAG: uncharacterized protein JWM74_476 [Myxococcaceae bacterium]|nr:uncharacterized protein [Myxococcaceae bacterium]